MATTSPWGTPPWHVDVEIPRAAVPRAVDVAVVGAGFAGLATAYELGRRGVRAHVFEASRVGAGASGHTGAIALEGTAIGPLEDADACLTSLGRLVAEAGIDCALRLDGCWELTHHPDDSARPLWRDGDVPLAIAGTVPGGTLDAGRLLAGLARAALDVGATIHEHLAVTGLDPAPVRLRTAAGAVAARTVVIAANAYTPLVVPLPVDLRAALTLAAATAPVSGATLAAAGLGERLPFYTIDLPYLWGRVLGDGRLVFGAGLVVPADGDVRATRIDDPEASAAFSRLEQRVGSLHPALAGLRLDARWGGPIAFVPGRPPLLGPHPERAGVIVTGGCAGHGVALSARIGELVAEHLASGRPLPSWGAVRPS